jgi:hypothetical protein
MLIKKVNIIQTIYKNEDKVYEFLSMLDCKE